MARSCTSRLKVSTGHGTLRVCACRRYNFASRSKERNPLGSTSSSGLGTTTKQGYIESKIQRTRLPCFALIRGGERLPGKMQQRARCRLRQMLTAHRIWNRHGEARGTGVRWEMRVGNAVTPAYFHDCSGKLGSTHPAEGVRQASADANHAADVAFARERTRQNFFCPGGRDNPLKGLISDKRIQGNPSSFLGKIWLDLVLALPDLAKFGIVLGLRRHSPKDAG